MIDDKKLEQLSLSLGKLLNQKSWHITTAESCTGGWIAKAITDIAGSSAYFQRGFVTYSNEAKHGMIGVNVSTLANFGAVSEQVVCEMALGALKSAGAQVAISVSGIAGPDGGNTEKPVGTVWFGLAITTQNGVKATGYHCCFKGNRHEVRLQSVHFALEKLITEITKISLDAV